jgi:hypothetical protein
VAAAGGTAKGFCEDDLRKLNFRELADRFEHLSQVLPDALRFSVPDTSDTHPCVCVCVRERERERERES